MLKFTQGKINDKVLLKILSGIILSVIFMLLGYAINNSIGRVTPPSFQNIFSKNIIILFLGLLSGYNISSSLKKKSSAYYFYAGIFFPLFIVVLYGLITNNELLSSSLIILGILFPIIFLHSGLVESHNKFKTFINLFAKYIPTISVITVAVGDFGIPVIEFQVNYDVGIYGYIPGFFIALFLLWLLYAYEENF